MYVPWRVTSVPDAVGWSMRRFDSLFVDVPYRKRDILTVYVLLHRSVVGRRLADPSLDALAKELQRVYNRHFPKMVGAFRVVEARRKVSAGLGDGYSMKRVAYDPDYFFLSERPAAWRVDPFQCVPTPLALWLCVRVIREYALRRGASEAAGDCDDLGEKLLHFARRHGKSVAWLRRRQEALRAAMQAVAARDDSEQVLPSIADSLSRQLDHHLAAMVPPSETTA